MERQKGTTFSTAARIADPAASNLRVKRAADELAKIDHLGGAAIVVKLAIGVPFCLLGPFMATVVAKTVEWNFKCDWFPSFWSTFGLALLLLLPLLFWSRRRGPASHFAEDAETGGSALDADSYGEYELRKHQLASAAFVDFIMAGPRMVGEALDGLRGRTGVSPALRQASAELAVDLFNAGEGVPLKSLARGGRSGQQLMRSAKYLLDRDWVGVSAKGDRIWLSTPARQKLGG